MPVSNIHSSGTGVRKGRPTQIVVNRTSVDEQYSDRLPSYLARFDDRTRNKQAVCNEFAETEWGSLLTGYPFPGHKDC